ncbi:MAG: hypothetical protein AAGK02_02895 [Pseudomonadota bacterium]
MKGPTIVAALLALFASPALADDVTYTIEGQVDLRTVPAADLKALGLTAQADATVSMEMVVSSTAPDNAGGSVNGAYRAKMIRIAIGRVKVSDPKRSASAIAAGKRNMVLRVIDDPVFDALGFEYAPLDTGALRHLERFIVGLPFDSTVLRSDALPTAPSLPGQMLSTSSSGPLLTLRTVKNTSFVLPVTSASMSIQSR